MEIVTNTNIVTTRKILALTKMGSRISFFIVSFIVRAVSLSYIRQYP